MHEMFQSATPSDTGLYHCQPDNAPEANITLHILKGKQILVILKWYYHSLDLPSFSGIPSNKGMAFKENFFGGCYILDFRSFKYD